jgi:hypothetical protein
MARKPTMTKRQRPDISTAKPGRVVIRNLPSGIAHWPRS